MEFVIQGQPKKLEAYKAILVRAGVTDEEVAYVGDDLPDLPLLERAGLAVAVGDAVRRSEARGALHHDREGRRRRGARGCGADSEVAGQMEEGHPASHRVMAISMQHS